MPFLAFKFLEDSTRWWASPRSTRSVWYPLDLVAGDVHQDAVMSMTDSPSPSPTVARPGQGAGVPADGQRRGVRYHRSKEEVISWASAHDSRLIVVHDATLTDTRRHPRVIDQLLLGLSPHTELFSGYIDSVRPIDQTGARAPRLHHEHPRRDQGDAGGPAPLLDQQHDARMVVENAGVPTSSASMATPIHFVWPVNGADRRVGLADVAPSRQAPRLVDLHPLRRGHASTTRWN